MPAKMCSQAQAVAAAQLRGKLVVAYVHTGKAGSCSPVIPKDDGSSLLSIFLPYKHLPEGETSANLLL